MIPRTPNGRQRVSHCGKPDCVRGHERARKQYQRRFIKAKAERCPTMCNRCGIRRRLAKPKGRGLYKWCRMCRVTAFADSEAMRARREAKKAAEMAAAREADLRMQEREARQRAVLPDAPKPVSRPKFGPLDAMEF